MIDLTNLLRTTALSGLLAVAGSGAAFAGPTTLTFNSFFPGPSNATQLPTDWNGSQKISVPTFDVTLGTLNSVTVTLLGDVTSSGLLTDTSPSGQASIFSYSSATEIMLLPVNYAGGAANAFSAALAVASPTLITLTGTRQNPIPLDAGASRSFSVTDAQATDGFTTSIGLGIYESVGAGSVLFPLFTDTSTLSNVSGGNLSLSQSTAAFAEVTITYDFSAAAIPEPASMALLGSGLAAIGIIRRRRV
jgi:PEP-CTERM motif